MANQSSTLSRIASGNIASLSNVGVTLVSNIAVVPIILSYWNADTYGLWLLLLSVSFLIRIPAQSLSQYLLREFIRIEGTEEACPNTLLASSLPIVISLAVLQLLIAMIIGPLGIGGEFLFKDSASEFGLSLFILSLGWALTSLIDYAPLRLAPLGYYPRFLWWNCLELFWAAIVPCMVCIAGGEILEAAIAMFVSRIIYATLAGIDYFRIYRKECIPIVAPVWSIVPRLFRISQAFTILLGLDNFKQQGLRLVIAPLAGISSMTSFSTIRTVSNIVHRGVTTIAIPISPELMRFIRSRDQMKSEALFNTIWMIVIVLIIPGSIVLQFVAESAFSIWTRGKIIYDPVLFSLLSSSILVHAIAQPAMSVVRGNNLLKEQLTYNAISVFLIVSLTALLIPLFGIKGVGVAILASEVTSLVLYFIRADHWLNNNGLHWPTYSFKWIALICGVEVSAIVLIASMPIASFKIGTFAFVFLSIASRYYWKSIPDGIREILGNALKKGFKKIPILGTRWA